MKDHFQPVEQSYGEMLIAEQAGKWGGRMRILLRVTVVAHLVAKELS